MQRSDPMQLNSLSDDLDHVLNHTRSLWESLRNQRIFITGGTGFFGCWLLESFVWANTALKLNASAFVLTRNCAQFKKKCPHLFSDPSLFFHEGDIKDFIFPQGHFSHIIHAATEACVNLNKNSPDNMFNTIVQGTKHTLDFAIHCGAQHVLLTSSGAIYGKQPSHFSHITEDYSADSADLESAYANGKREAEKIAVHYASHFNLNIKIARCFAFVGPYLPLDSHFAIGNFIRDGLNQRTIIINGNGAPYRSYLYAADLAIWLWTILFMGEKMRPYNVGSNESITIKELAFLISSTFEPNIAVHIEQPISTQEAVRYVPDVTRAQHELNLIPHIGLTQAIRLTKKWHLSQ